MPQHWPLFNLCALYLAASLGQAPLRAQTPQIWSNERSTGIYGESLVLSGSGFSTRKEDLVVRFGTSRAELIRATEQVIEVRIPQGATFDYLSVTHLQSALTGHSPKKFLPTYQATSFEASRLSSYSEISPGFNIYDLCTCDFDGDGLNDLAIADQTEGMSSGSIMVFRNTTPANSHNIQFERINDLDLVTGTAVRNIACADLNGDGLPDLVVGKGGNTADRLFLIMNKSTPGNIDFAAFRTLMISGSSSSNSARRIKIHDLNDDGKPEIILTDQNQPRVHVFQNRSTPSQFSFPLAEKIEIQSPSALSTSGLDIADLDSDGKAEIIFNSANAPGLFVVPNRSTYGSAAFGNPSALPVTEALNNVIALDIDGDGMVDLAATSSETNRLIILLKTEAGIISAFGSPLRLTTGSRPWGISAGDITGNGKPDILTATSDPGAELSLFINQSLPGALNLARHNIGPAELSINVLVADFNGDARPDLAYSTNQKKVAFIRNRLCIHPAITPTDPGPICGTQAITLRIPEMPKTEVYWEDNAGNIMAAGQYRFSTADPGQFRAILNIPVDGCSQSSDFVSLVSGGASSVSLPAIQAPSSVCAGDSLVLSTVALSGHSYTWTKPDGSQHTGSSLVIPVTSLRDAGRYGLVATTAGGCRSETAFAFVGIGPAPVVGITALSGSPFCLGTENVLITGAINGAVYSWFRNGTKLSQTSENTFSVDDGGIYRIEVETTSGCRASSPDLLLVRVSKPQASFTSATSICTGNVLEFTNTSSFDGAVLPQVRWDFGDDTFSGETDPVHLYASSGTFYPFLELFYESDTSCRSRYGYPVLVSGSTGDPVILADGTIPENPYYLCPERAVILSTTAGPSGLLWNTGATGQSIVVSEPGSYELISGAGSACERRSEIHIAPAPAPEITVKEREIRIKLGESAQLEAAGADSYLWQPGTYLNNNTASNPVTRPESSIVYRVTGTNSYGCSDTDSVTVEVEPITFISVDAPRIFTPNGDGHNDVWIIRNIDELSGCAIRIFNRQGLTVYESTPYLNDWDGTYGKSDAPVGAYYYLINCPDGQVLRGDITLLR